MRRHSRAAGVSVEWECVELVRPPALSATLGEPTSRLKLKVYLRGEKLRTYDNVLSIKSAHEFGEPLLLSCATSLHTVMCVSLQTEALSRTIAQAEAPLRTLEVLAERPHRHTIRLVDAGGSTLALAHCRLGLRFGSDTSDARATRFQQEQQGCLPQPAQGVMGWLGGALSLRCLGHEAVPPPVRQLSSRSGIKKRVTIHPDFHPDPPAEPPSDRRP